MENTKKLRASPFLFELSQAGVMFVPAQPKQKCQAEMKPQVITSPQRSNPHDTFIHVLLPSHPASFFFLLFFFRTIKACERWVEED